MHTKLFIALLIVAILIGFYFVIGQYTWLISTIVAFDHTFEAAIEGRQSLGLAKFFLFFTYLGNWQVIFFVVLVSLVVLLRLKKREVAIFFVGLLGLGTLVAFFIKEFVERVRPESYYLLEYHSHSFPSALALLATLCYGFLGYLLAKFFQKKWQDMIVVTVTAALIVLIGTSRVYLGVHWVSDVIAGWILGVALFALCIYTLEYLERRIQRLR